MKNALSSLKSVRLRAEGVGFFTTLILTLIAAIFIVGSSMSCGSDWNVTLVIAILLGTAAVIVSVLVGVFTGWATTKDASIALFWPWLLITIILSAFLGLQIAVRSATTAPNPLPDACRIEL